MPVSVSLIRRAGRPHFEARWIDPVTGLKKTRTTRTAVRRDAERFAARIELELNESGSIDPALTTWAEVEERYKSEVLPALASATARKVNSTFTKIKDLVNPRLASALDASQISRFTTLMRAAKPKPSEYTIKGHLSVLSRVLGWASRMGLIKTIPNIEMPKRLTGMKGRAITKEEFDRMIAAVPHVVPKEAVASWEHLLNGLWLSGLRLSEAMKLHWTDTRQIAVDFTGRRPMMRIQAADDKGKRFRLLPITREFAEFLQQTPESTRKGHVFNPRPLRPPFAVRLLEDWVSKTISRIGAKALVLVNAKKHASAHDLRRSFGFRWSRLVMPAVLQELMRHESINTTMHFYVGQNAEATADSVWAASTQPIGNDSGNTHHSEADSTQSRKHKTA